MKEHPILFSTPMVQAILNGNKTMTRRVCKLDTANFDYDLTDKDYGPFLQDKYGDSIDVKTLCPYGQPGDRLWVRETWCHLWDGANDIWSDPPRYHYKADGYEVVNVDKPLGSPWKPSIHMPKDAARIFLEVVSVRVERVQDMNRADSFLEGCPQEIGGRDGDIEAAYLWFRDIWESINSKRGYGWEQNPWIWVVEFKKVEDNA